MTARVLLCAVFLTAALGYTVPSLSAVAQAAAARGNLPSEWTLGAAVFLLAGGCLSVIAGYRARVGASFLFGFLLLATCCCHGFSVWAVVSPEFRQEQILRFVTNLSLMGAMLFIVANGAGRASLDAKRR